jgi:molecular chaperone DnaK (HSP70)
VRRAWMKEGFDLGQSRSVVSASLLNPVRSYSAHTYDSSVYDRSMASCVHVHGREKETGEFWSGPGARTCAAT